MRSIMLLLTAVLLAGCAGDVAGESAGPAPTPAAPATEAGASPEPTVVPTPTAAGAQITGMLRFDPALEGGCAWLETDEGPYQVQWPRGYRVQPDPVALVGPDGEVVASADEEITVTGGEAAGMMTACQVGPVWRARAVVAPQDTG